jgi:DNA-binding MarR family transcriptional regulator
MSRGPDDDFEAARAAARPAGDSPFALGLLLRRAHARAAAMMSGAVRPYGLELRHFAVLIVLVERGPTTQRDLGAETGFDKAAIMRAVDDLEAAGYAVRRPVVGDRRVRAVDITARGLEVFRAAHVSAEGMADQLLAHLRPGEGDLLMDLLTRFTYPPTGDS